MLQSLLRRLTPHSSSSSSSLLAAVAASSSSSSSLSSSAAAAAGPWRFLFQRHRRLFFLASPCAAPHLSERSRPPLSSSIKRRCTNQPSSQEDSIDFSKLDTYNFGEPSYWDNRYTVDADPVDWYQSYSGFAPIIRKHVPKCGRVLMVGCGNAEMSEEMIRDGYEEIVNIDLSQVVIDAMQKKYSKVPQLKYLQMDAQDLSVFSNCYFDSVIDKGTLDAMMCARNATSCIARMLAEVSRTLKPGGVFLLITYGDIQSRLPDLNRKEYSWTIDLYSIPIPGTKKALEDCSRAVDEPLIVNCNSSHEDSFMSKDRDTHYIYVCHKALNTQNIRNSAESPLPHPSLVSCTGNSAL